MTARTRVPAGTPNGGQFTGTKRAEPEMRLNATSSQAIAWTHEFFDADEGEPWLTVCESSRRAGGKCNEVSETFASYLSARGIPDVHILDCDASGHDYVPDGSPHTVVEVQGLVVDLTHRQFDDGADLPHVESVTDFLASWKVIDRD